ncbi:MAG TPA: aminotransferase class V-fold PLP-dependent enzyme [Candidatus Dormibacteraeota bacterium]|nr:aminotransferase class V-fold PLP-dependent enzyme [Candidatus Dormibacteraeota bacterium]
MPDAVPPSATAAPGPSALDRRSRWPWLLDPSVAFLNHGSFGACPAPVLEAQAAWRERMEREPVRFLDRDLEGLLDDVRTELGAFIGADPDGLAFVPNATHAVASVLGSLRFEPGDELLATDHEYNASLNALARTADRDGARIVLARLPFPIEGPEVVVERLLAAATPRTRLVLVSHVTSPTALILPIERIVTAFEARGIPVLVDGAHGPGQLPLAIDRLAASFYTGNAHKWLCAPKGSAFLHVRADRRAAIRPLPTSHGANDPRLDRPRFRLEWDWTGTADPSAYLAIPAAIRFLESLRPGGAAELMATNHSLAVVARDRLVDALAIPPPAPDEMLGAMAAVPLPIERGDAERAARVQAAVLAEGVEAPITAWPVRAAQRDGRPDAWLVRVSTPSYVEMKDVERLATALGRALDEG